MPSWLADFWPAIVSIAHIAAAIAVTVDAVLRKRHVPAIIGWVGLAWLAPLLGSLLYLGFGINRIQRSAAALNLQAAWPSQAETGVSAADAVACSDDIRVRYPTLAGLVRLGQRITGLPLLAGNRIELLKDGDEAFPAMLAAIDGAERSIALQTYIFDNDATGAMFLDALTRAQARGVQVRVLMDDVGSRYTRPTMVKRLRTARIPVATFLPTRLPNLFRYANLRSHRKILVADGLLGFTGGMNIREGHWLARRPAGPVHCLHFRVEGPVVADLRRTFAADWAFTTGEHLGGDRWLPALAARGTVAARGVSDGPDADLDNMLHMMLGALAVATRRVRIITPYFLPDDHLLRAVQVAAMRGIEVDIVLPAKSNIPLMDWAMAPQLRDLLQKGCRIYFTQPVFDHTKALLVDDVWSLIGSTNWDARSLRLNFEYNLECYDEALAAQLNALIDAKIAVAKRVELDEVSNLPFLIRFRNGLARLMSPYL